MMSSNAKFKNKQRDPPPVLFLHPSPGASHVSLSGILASGNPIPPTSSVKRESAHKDTPNPARTAPTIASKQQRLSRTLYHTESSRGSDRTNALWAEMQATLEEVELSASEGTHVFGPEHDRKLADLRAAQIALAQAWARSEADEAIESTFRDHMVATAKDELPNGKVVVSDTHKQATGDGTDAARSAAGTTSGRPGSSGGPDRLGAKLEEETEADILHARQRREANDEYFQRVNNGVLDVVAKLESVAVAMRAVEQETKDLWSENMGPHDHPGL